MLAKMIKQREESAATYDSGGRPELAAAEREEIAIIQGFLPEQMSDAEAKRPPRPSSPKSAPPP